VVVALVVGALLTVPATPAQAAPSIGNVSASPNSVDAGGTVKVTFSLNFTDPLSSADVSVTSSNPKLTCVDGCSRGRVNQDGTYDATLRAASDASDGSATITIRATDSNGPNKQTESASVTVTIVGKAQPTQEQTQTVKSISGKVVIAANNEPLSGATVMLRDSKGKSRSTTSDGSGNFRFTGSTSDPIAPGRIDLGAKKGDADPGTKSINVGPGEAVTGLRISVAVKVEVTPSVTPSESEEALPTEEATDDTATAEDDAGATEAAPAAQQPAANQESGGFGNWLLILLGGLFVAVGVGTIVLLYLRRKNEGDDADGDDPAGPRGPGGAAAAGAVPAARGAYRGVDEQTRVVNGMGAGAAPTMVGGAGLSEAPTMMHRPVVDDVPPDPYGAPPGPTYGSGAQGGYGYGEEAPGQGGYGGNSYGNAPSSGGGYGNAPSSGGGYGNAPSSGGGYDSASYGDGGYDRRGDHGAGAGAGGYPPAQGGGYGNDRYDEPTGRYTGDSTQYAPPADPYPTSTYQPDEGRGYDQPGQGQGQYGRGAEQGNSYGSDGGYGAPSGGYDNGPGGGYDSRQQGYDGGQQQGYDGYDQRGGYAGGDGYGQPQQGGYGQQGGYSPEQPPQQRSGGYDNQGYDQGGYYNDPAQAGRGRQDGSHDRGGRRLDWLDD